jgi:hypothetical protein
MTRQSGRAWSESQISRTKIQEPRSKNQEPRTKNQENLKFQEAEKSIDMKDKSDLNAAVRFVWFLVLEIWTFG